MDWITTSGNSLHEAKSNALDQLGIVADEAEFDVIADVQKGLFGRIKSEAKVRARVRPKQPAQTDDRNSRRRSGGSNGGGRNRSRGNNKGGNKNNNGGGRGNNRSNNGNGSNGGESGNKNAEGNNGGANQSQSRDGNKQKQGGGGNRSRNSNNRNSGENKSGAGASAAASTSRNKPKKKENVEETLMSRPDQERTAQEFLEGVLGAFGMTGEVSVSGDADDDAIEMGVTGQELGLLVGQKGVTLNALQELTRTVVQRHADGAKTNRLRVDVAGYRARRNEALTEFAQKIAADVAESGNEKLLEPMGPADRKVVHDAVNDIEGVETGSEGEEPRRRVVIRPV